MSPAVRPLDLPEIIARVGHFLPLWARKRVSGGRRKTVFKPKTFHDCLLVSKLWHQTLLPILWVLYDAEGMYRVPAYTLLSNGHYFRTFYMQSGEYGSGPFQSTRLVNAYLCPDVDKLVQTQQLVKDNPDLRSLEWIGPNGSHCLEPEYLTHLSQLEHLALSRWDASEGRFDTILEALAGSLKRLEIGWFMKVVDKGEWGKGEVLEKDDEGEQQQGQVMTTEESDNDHVKKPPMFPALEFYRGLNAPSAPDPAKFVKSCPNLRRLELTLDKYGSNNLIDNDLARISDSLRECCPRLHALVVKGSIGQEHKAKLIRDCAITNSLSELVVELSFIGKEPIDAIVRHAPTLETLGVHNTADDNDDASLDLLFQLPARCLRLKHLSITAWFCYGKTQSILDIIKSTISSWQCHELEVLDLDIGDSSEGCSWDDRSALDEIFNKGPVLGWYYHPQESVPDDIDNLWNRASLENVFEAVMELTRLCVLRWYGVVFTRAGHRASARFGSPSMLF